ncbi:MAG: winged helix-turn-helix transcriptional regulator [bacterium]|nr:winged helix-turn-helix transcriptional regulator [bacterium]
MDELTATTRALADATRRTVLELLRDGGQSVSDLARHFSMSRPAVSKHLAILRDSGLVSARREGRQQIYELDAAKLEPVREWLAGLCADDGDEDSDQGEPAPTRPSRRPTRRQGTWRSW